MALIVQKYGSLGAPILTSSKRVAKRIIETKTLATARRCSGFRMGDTTDDLIDRAMSIDSTPPAREMDMLAAASGSVFP